MGDDDVQVSGSIGNHVWVDAGQGNDRVKAGGGHSIILGNAGDDLLVGGDGRDLLIGGTGADRIVGNADEDILVAGATDFDANELALAALLAEWTSARSYTQRTSNISGVTSGSSFGSRLNGNYFLNVEASQGPVTVHDDGTKDTLNGGLNQDWFFANLFLDGGDDADQKNKITDLSAVEFALDLDFIGV